MKKISGCELARILAAAALLTAFAVQAEAPNIAWRLVKTYPHDAHDFTQGLVWSEGRLYESAGQYGSSRLAEKKLATGRTLHETKVPATEFAEGLTLLGQQLWQLTWREGVAHIYDLALKPLATKHYLGEGWGLTSDGRQLIVSDGSPSLYFVVPESVTADRSVTVHDGAQLISQLNELEWVRGAIFANVWTTQKIARIDPASGEVTGWLDCAQLEVLAGITPEQHQAGAVLNGIAWRADKGHLLITGKWWPKLFEIELLPAEGK